MTQSSLSLALFCFGSYLVLLLLFLRLLKKIAPAFLVCAFAVFVYGLALLLIGLSQWQVSFFFFSSLYWFLALSLIMLFGATYKSISLRMMLHLLDQPGKRDTRQALLENYIQSQSYHKRLDILLEQNWLERSENASFRLTPKGLRFARWLGKAQQLFSIHNSG